jgi:FAD/FMN-containing dehydrogenase
MKWGAGVGVGHAMQAASKLGYTVVGGECGTVGLAGGYSQGGGHSILNSAYGLAADQALEWEVVTGEGKHLIATPLENSDIYWALSGGGGGTYGVVVSMTGKLHPEMRVAGASLTFNNTDVPEDVYWEAVGLWYKHLPEYVSGTNNTIQFVIWKDNLAAQSLNLLDQHSSAFGPMLGPFLEELDDRGIKYVLTTTDSDTYFEHFNKYYGPLPYGIEPPTTILNSRLVPKSVVLDPKANAKLIDAVRQTVETGEFLMGCSALDVNIDHPHNAVHPAWRDSIGPCIMNAFWNWTAPLEYNMEVKSRMVEVYVPAMEAATPGSGVYLNEMDPLYQGDWKQSMFGANHAQLLEVKRKYDPRSLFYGHFAVGSDEFTIDGAGRLCPRQSFREEL